MAHLTKDGAEVVELLAHLHRLVHVLVYEWGRWKENCRKCRDCFVKRKAGKCCVCSRVSDG